MMVNRSPTNGLPTLPRPQLLGALAVGGAALAALGGVLAADASGGSQAAATAIIGPLACAIALVLVVKVPGVLFALYLTAPFYKGVIPSPVDLTIALAVLATISTAPHLLRMLAKGNDWKLLGLWFAVCATITVGTVVNGDSDEAISVLVTFVLLIGVAGLSGLVVARDPSLRRQFAWTLFALGCITTAAGLVNRPELGSLYRATVFEGNPINTARSALLVVVAGLPLLWARGKAVVVLALPLIAASVWVAFTTASRGPVVFAAVALVIMSMATTSARHAGRRLAVIAGVLLAFTSLPLPSLIERFLPSMGADRIGSIGSAVQTLIGNGGEDLGASEVSRVESWKLAVRMFEQRPVLGWGAGQFADFTPEIGFPDIAYPHNSLLHAAAEFGLLGLLVFGGVLVVATLRCVRSQADPAATVVATVALFTILGSMVSGSLIEDRMLWGMVLMALALPKTGGDHSSTTATLGDQRADDVRRFGDRERVSVATWADR